MYYNSRLLYSKFVFFPLQIGYLKSTFNNSTVFIFHPKYFSVDLQHSTRSYIYLIDVASFVCLGTRKKERKTTLPYILSLKGKM